MARPTTVELARDAIHTRLRDRQGEIEREALSRIAAVLDGVDRSRADFKKGLRATVRSAVDYGIDIVQRGEGPAPTPTELLTHARLAARNGLGLDTVFQCYVAGYSLISDYVVVTAEEGDRHGATALKPVLRAQAVSLTRLLGEVSEEYSREAQKRLETKEQRRAEQIERLLAGELVDTSSLAYDFTGFQLAVIASGPDSLAAVRSLAQRAGCRLLSTRRSERTTWGWLGRRHPIDTEELERQLSISWPMDLTLVFGELGEGISGWRLSHRQARAALPIALSRDDTIVHYADVALLASAMQDDLLVTSLALLYLEPLNLESDGGKVAKETLRAYLSAQRSASSAAAILNVSRRTIDNRLRRIEARLGCSLNAVLGEIELALHLEDLSILSKAV